MEWFKELFNQVSSLFKWWVIILPWERGLRIRMGNRVKELQPGMHFRIPYLDSVYAQPIRLTFVNFSPQTLTTKKGDLLTIQMIVGYSIKNISQLYNSVSEVQSVISGKVMGRVAQYITENDDCTPEAIAQDARKVLSELGWGLTISDVEVITFAKTKTYRLIQEPGWMAAGQHLETKR